MTAATLTRPQAQVTAREMWASGAWGKTEITRYLNDRGVKVHRITVSRWVDDHAAAAKRAEDDRRVARRSMTRSGRLGRTDARPEFKLRRIRALDAAGLTATAIAKVMTVDFGDELSAQQVREALRLGRYPFMRMAEAARLRTLARAA